MDPVALLVTLLELVSAELLLAPVFLLVVVLVVVLTVEVVVEVVAGDLAAWDWLQGSPRLGRAAHFNCKLPS